LIKPKAINAGRPRDEGTTTMTSLFASPALSRRSLGLLGAALTLSTGAEAQPTQHGRVVVPFGPGGTSDILARLLVASINRATGRSTIVENRPGAGASIGSDFVAKSAPDGQTLLLLDVGALAIAPNLFPNLPFNVANDLLPVTMLTYTPYVVAVHPSVPVRTAQELVALAQRNPERLTASNSGAGALTHLTSLVLVNAWGARQATQVTYRGSGPAIAAAVAGEVTMVASTIDAMQPFLQSNTLRPLAISGAARLAAFPDMPTFAELGWPLPDVGSWQGVLTQGRTPPAIRDRLEREFMAAIADAEVARRMEVLGVTAHARGGSQLREWLATNTAEMGRVIRENDVRID
jgi:tripartite-type tricarboxylate transporter receptor subunit TctC